MRFCIPATSSSRNRRNRVLICLGLLVTLSPRFYVFALRLRHDLGDCDMNAMCFAYHRKVVMSQSLCNPAEGCFDRYQYVNCADNNSGPSFFTPLGCRAQDCILMKALAVSASVCNSVFPKVVGTNMEREPAFLTQYQRGNFERSNEVQQYLIPKGREIDTSKMRKLWRGTG